MPANWYKEQPKNRNFLTPTGFKLVLEKFEGVDFFCQSVNLPNVEMPVTEVPTRFRSLPIIPGGGVSYGDLQIQFIIDEDLVNYTSVWNWIKRNGGAEDHMEGEVEYTAAQLMIQTSAYNINFIIDFEHIFPVSLTDIRFDATVNDIEFITATTNFKFSRYTIRDQQFKPIG